MSKISVISLVFAFFFLVGCEVPEIRTISETYDTSEDSLYVQCADLKGLGNLHIGKTVYKDLFKDDFITKVKYNGYLDSDFHLGFWGVRSDFDLVRHIENDKRIKQIEVGDLTNPYTIGELEFDEMELAFLNDTLVAISIGGDYYKIEKHLVKKYGEGKGYYEFYCKSKGQNGDKNFYMEKRERRLRIWENEIIKFEKKYEWDSKVVNNEDVYSIQGDDYCLITSKNRYNEFLRILEECKQDFKNQKETAKQKSYEML